MRALLFVLVFAMASCSSGGRTPGDPDAGGGDDDDVQPADATSIDAAPPRFLCDLDPPAGAPMPEAPPLPAGGCPTLVAGTNPITSGGHEREFILVLPDAIGEGERFPVLVLWHWLGGDAEAFLERGQIQEAADQQRFIAIIPSSRGATVFGTSFNTRWPFDITQSADRMDEEFTFFDDMLACVEAQFAVNQSCVSSIGVSAGALFTDQLAQARSQRLASFVSLSGGVGATIIKPWDGAARKLPALILYGGDGPPAMDGVRDILGCFGIGMDFSVASRQLESDLVDDGHFLVECKHNCGHVEPPLEAPPGESKYAAIWQFAMDHPFWLGAGESPYLTGGIPAGAPAWCGIGEGGSTPRTGGGCPEPENPCPY